MASSLKRAKRLAGAACSPAAHANAIGQPVNRGMGGLPWGENRLRWPPGESWGLTRRANNCPALTGGAFFALAVVRLTRSQLWRAVVAERRCEESFLPAPHRRSPVSSRAGLLFARILVRSQSRLPRNFAG